MCTKINFVFFLGYLPGKTGVFGGFLPVSFEYFICDVFSICWNGVNSTPKKKTRRFYLVDADYISNLDNTARLYPKRAVATCSTTNWPMGLGTQK